MRTLIRIIILLLFLSFSTNIISCGFEDSLPCVDDCEETNEEEQDDEEEQEKKDQSYFLYMLNQTKLKIYESIY